MSEDPRAGNPKLEEPRLEDLNFVMKARREKLAELEAAGIAPFAYGFDPTHDASSALRACLPSSCRGTSTTRPR